MNPLRKISELMGFSDREVDDAEDAFELEVGLFHPITEDKYKGLKEIFLEAFRQVWDMVYKGGNPLSKSQIGAIGKFFESRGNWTSPDYLENYGTFLGYIVGMLKCRIKETLDNADIFAQWFDILRAKEDDKVFYEFIKNAGYTWIKSIKKKPQLIFDTTMQKKYFALANRINT